MTKNGGNKKQTKGQRREDLERKRDDRVRRNALKKERKAKEYLEEDENFLSFSNQLEALGLKIKDIPGDGNCLFRSLGDQIDGDHTTHARHRRETVKYMRDHKDDFEPFMEDNISFDQHLQDLCKLSTYGGNDSIVAFARNHGVNIVIHQLNEPRWVIYGGDYCKNGQVHELHISYHNGEHYSSVRHISDNSTEPAWIKHNQAMFTAVAMPTKTETSGNRKEKKSKEKGKRKETIAASGTDDKDHVQGRGIIAAEELVMTATGCKDLVTIAQALEDNSYDVDASVNYILQLMYVAEETGHCLSNELFVPSTEASNEHIQSAGCCVLGETCVVKETKDCENIDSICESHINCGTDDSARTSLEDRETCLNPSSEQSGAIQDFIEDLRETLSQSNQKTSKSYEYQGARPKVTDKSKNRQESSNAHLSNKKRKELAKQEKKKHREERRKDNNPSSCYDADSVTTGEQHVTSSVISDLGLLAI